MRVKIKTLHQENFTLELSPSTTAEEIRKQIQKEHGHNLEQMKLIYSGKLLKDEDTLESLGFEEKDFMVLMVTKPRVGTSKKEEPKEEEKTTEPRESVESSNSASLDSESGYKKTLNDLMEMGFPREQVILAMNAAFNNPERAAEYLVSGNLIGAGLQSGESMQAHNQSSALNEPGATRHPINFFEAAANEVARNRQQLGLQDMDISASELRDQLMRISNSAQFQQIRQLMESDPQMIQPLLQQISDLSPGMAQLISRNQEQFMNILEEETPGSAALEGAMPPNPSAHTSLSITTADNDAIERLVALGFDRSLAIEAFLVCDKDEQLAANYLIDLARV